MSNTIIDWIVEQKLAKNNFAAAHIANGLQLYKIANDLTEQKKRVELYRKWRNATKDAPVKCYEYVLEGKEPPAELFDEKEKAVGVRKIINELGFEQYQ